MKKIGLLCLALVLALGTVGMGFAYWTETLTIEDTNHNTGDMDVEYVADGYWYFDYPHANALPPVSATAHYDPADPHKMWIDVENMYPGASVAIGFLIENMGTIPVKLTGCTITKTSGSDQLWDNDMRGRLTASMWDRTTGQRVDMRPGVVGIKTSWAKMPILGGCIAWELRDVVIQPNYYLRFDASEGDEDGSIQFKLLKTSENGTENSNIAFTVEFTFEQFNAP